MNENLIKVQGHDNLVRDPKSNAILNIDTSSFQEYMEKRMRDRQREADRIAQIEDLYERLDRLERLIATRNA